MKNSSIQGLWFLIGCKKNRKGEKRQEEVAWGQKGIKMNDERRCERLERQNRREEKQQDNARPESAVILAALSTEIYHPSGFFSAKTSLIPGIVFFWKQKIKCSR